MKRYLPLLAAVFVVSSPLSVHAVEPFKFKDGDRVVLLGNTLIEREQRYGYWELALTTRFPDKNITFRNLGWSGDTVWGDARAGFGTQADGFKHLKEHVASLKPTVIIVGYGNNEAFAGEAGLPRFLDGLNKLLDTLDENKARIVMLSPLCQEDMGRPLPVPTEQNKNIRLYSDAMRKVANKRGYVFVDLYQNQRPDDDLLTDNGIHLNAAGYWHTGCVLLHELGYQFTPSSYEFGGPKRTVIGEGTKIKIGDGHYQLTDAALPTAKERLLRSAMTEPARWVRVRGRGDGKYTLSIDGKAVRTETADDWERGILLCNGPEFDQVEKLRQAIIEKNRLYFHRWRPQNETYLFGFRKHEQGQNAVEIPQFDPLVAKLEEEIAKLRVPVEHKYEIRPAKEGEK